MATFTNRAFLTYNNITTGSNIATGEIIEVLSLTKTAVTDEYTVGERITYVVSAINSGTTPLTGLTLTDNLGSYTYETGTLIPLTYVPDSFIYYVNGILQPTPAVTAGPPLTVTGLSIPAGGNATFIYAADVNAFAPLAAGGDVTNTATLSGGGINTPASATETVTALSAPALTITKSISPGTVTENSRVTYTFVIQNYGNAAVIATDNAVVTDTFNPILTDLTVSFDGTIWTEGTQYTYNADSGAFATVAGNLTVPAATYTRDPVSGAVVTDPGTVVLTVTGTI
jgi:uncharacterized repeat protein (TIGR01451 family)